jgi:hypothetical protein
MSAPLRIPKSSLSPISKGGKSPRIGSAASSPKSSAGAGKGSARRQSRPELMSSSLRSQDDYLVYEIHSGGSGRGDSVVIIPKSSQGFSWNEGASFFCAG